MFSMKQFPFLSKIKKVLDKLEFCGIMHLVPTRRLSSAG